MIILSTYTPYTNLTLYDGSYCSMSFEYSKNLKAYMNIVYVKILKVI